MWLGVLLLLIALPLQLMGLTSTCTQGADGTFVTGAVLSSPFLVFAVIRLAMSGWRRRAGFAASTVAIAIPVLTMWLTASAWTGTLLHGTPCGEFYADYSSSVPVVALIVVAYVGLPLLVIAAVPWALWRSRSAPFSP